MPFHLEVYAWEGRTHPDAGLPQEVILKQIPIEKCDIFIGIFWKRFGTPPGTFRPRDGRPYLSGTEEEIDKAFEARRKSPDSRPIIMLYRKMDSLPLCMTEEDYLQYARVIEFFRQCEPGGEHPALVAQFVGEQFQTLLREHLLQAVREFEEEKGPRTRAPSLLLREPVIPSEPMTRWLDQIGLRDNPFQEHVACSRENLQHFFVPFRHFRLSELANDTQTWVIFGNEGCGKTSLRWMVATQCYPKIKDSVILCVEFGTDELKQVVEWATSAERTHHRRLGFPLPEPSSAQLGPSVTATILRWALAFTVFISQNLPEEVQESLELNLNTFSPLKALFLSVQKAGFSRILCLIDEIDMLPTVRGEPAKMVDLLAQLMAPALREAEGIAFRYFLPAYLAAPLFQRRSQFRLDRCKVGYLLWEREDLKRLISQRLIAFSKTPLSPRQSLGELCDQASDFAGRVEDELVALAEGNPRAAIYLAEQLFRFHCQEDPVHRWIRAETWERVKAEWWLRGRAQILGPIGGESGFYLCGDQIYFNDRPVALPTRYHALLYCLIRARGAVCSRSDLARAGWPEDDLSGVTERAIDEAMRRLKRKLQEQGIDPEWIETVRGRGYRLRTLQNTSSEKD